MPAVPVTMQELELEHAELLPPRETLSYQSGHPRSTTVAGSGDGNTEQHGLVNVSAGNGDLDGDGNAGHGTTVAGSDDGNTEQQGLVNVSAGNGDLDGDGNAE
jgi:hypothetical protein